MKKNHPVNEAAMIPEITAKLCASYRQGEAVSYLDDQDLPQRELVIEVLEQMLELLFPGYSGCVGFRRDSLDFTTGELLSRVRHALARQLGRALCYNCRVEQHREESCGADDMPKCRARAEEMADAFLRKLPAIREMLLLDCQAALDGDPATRSKDEIILAYPGFKAIAIHRLAHELYTAKVPLVPRIMSEYAHTMTGIDINPGATIGRSFFIDHGTGVVIGETAVLGDNVKLYQGVTLGALSFPKDGCGHLIKGTKRHPNLEDNVTVYAGATILGDVTIAHHSVIGGNVWLTDSIPEPYSRVVFTPAEMSIRIRKNNLPYDPLLFAGANI